MNGLFDLHTHSSRSFDNKRGPSIEEIARRASEIGLTGIAITDHDILPPLKELESLSEAFDILIFPGCEITTDKGHIIAIGPLKELPPSHNIQSVLSFLKTKNILVIAAHPFDKKYGIGDYIRELPIHAIEVNGRRAHRTNQEAKRIANELAIPLVGGSDAHQIDQLGSIVTRLKKNVETVTDLINCVERGETSVSSVRSRTRFSLSS